MAVRNLGKKAQVRLIVGIFTILFGGLAALFLGLGIALNNIDLTWMGGILMSAIPFALAILTRFIK